MDKYAPVLWLAVGVFLMLPSVLGYDRAELIPIGIVFLVIGIATKKKNAKSSDSKNQR